MRIESIVNKRKLNEKILNALNEKSGADLKEFLQNITVNDNLYKNIFSFYLEDIPFDNVKGDKIYSSAYEYIENGLISHKSKFLDEELNITVYINSKKHISYSSIENLKNSYKNLLENYKNKEILMKIGITEDKYGLFLKILQTEENNTIKIIQPEYLNSDSIILYSYLLNYEKIPQQVFNTITENLNLMIQYPEWGECREAFLDFVKFIKLGTIHY